MVTGDEVRAFAATLPRAYEAFVRDQVKFRIGQIVFLALSPDEMRELVVEAWRMCVPKKVWSAYLETHPL